MVDPTPPPPNWGPAPSAPQGWSPQTTPPPAWAASTGWNQPPPTVPFTHRPGAMEGLSRWVKLIGLALVVIGALVAVIAASPPGNCVQTGANCSPSGTDFPAQALWGMLAGRLLLVLGFGALALGGFLKMRWGDGMPASGRAEEVNYVLADRRWNGLLIGISLIVLFLLVVTLPLFWGAIPPFP
jgi:hypothetical protein